MEQVNIHEAKTHFSKLVERAEAGEEIVIARSGEPVAKLVPFAERKRPRKLGGWEGKVWIAPDFDEEDEEIVRLFEGEESWWPE
jgi:prevent-host-death family protein